MIGRAATCAAALALTACFDPIDVGPEADVGRFDPAHVVKVELALAPGDWDALRTQTRSWVEVYNACLAAPFESPFTWFAADVNIDGEPAAAARVRKKGFLGSLSVDKPSLKLEVDGETITLNNAQQDPSLLRQCLSYRVFALAALPAPRCNFAHVRVDNHDLGLYVHVEEIDARFLASHFDDPTGNLYEATFSDFRAGWTATFEAETNPDGDHGDLAAAVAALEAPDDQLLAAMDEVIDLQQLLRFWAVEVLLTRTDGFAGNANNYFTYHDPESDRFVLLPWGADVSFRAGDDPFGSGAVSVQTGSLAPWRLLQLPEGRARYLATLRGLLDSVWDEQALLAEIDRMERLITPYERDGLALEEAIEEVRGFVRDRRGAILDELARNGGDVPVSAARLGEPPCFETIGAVSGSLKTTWGTMGGDYFAGGDGTLQATLGDTALAIGEVGATAGWVPNEPSTGKLAIAGALPGGEVELVTFRIDGHRLQPGAELPIDWIAASGWVFRWSPVSGHLDFIGFVPDGMVRLESIATVDGAAVTASFSGPVVRSPL